MLSKRLVWRVEKQNVRSVCLIDRCVCEGAVERHLKLWTETCGFNSCHQRQKIGGACDTLPEKNCPLWWWQCSETHCSQQTTDSWGWLFFVIIQRYYRIIQAGKDLQDHLTDQLSEPLLFPPLCNFADTDGFGAEQSTHSPHTNKQVIQNTEKIWCFQLFQFRLQSETRIKPFSQAMQPKACLGSLLVSKTIRDSSWCCWCWNGPSTPRAHSERPSQFISFHAMGMLPQATDSLLTQAPVWDATIPCRVQEMRMRSTLKMPSVSHCLW